MDRVPDAWDQVATKYLALALASTCVVLPKRSIDITLLMGAQLGAAIAFGSAAIPCRSTTLSVLSGVLFGLLPPVSKWSDRRIFGPAERALEETAPRIAENLTS